MTENEDIKFKRIAAPEGVHDVLPEDHEYFALIKKVARYRARQAGFRRITPPTFEHRNLFERSIWDWTDIVEKELFTFKSKSWRHEYALRPELTAWIARAYVEHWMSSLPQPVHFYSFEPIFRYDRPQKNRYRQFHQFNVEVIWESDPWIDAQLIHLAWSILRDLKIHNNLIVRINYLCYWKAKERYISDLKNYFEWRKRSLCENCSNRFEINPMRILDCKEEDCKLIASKSPSVNLYLSDEEKEYFQDVLDLLKAVEIPYKLDHSLVRWLDYYTGTVFEIVDSNETWAQCSLAWWGSYNNLIEILWWAPNTPATWLGIWVERIINRMKEIWVKSPTKDTIHVFVAQIGKQAKLKALPLIEKLQSLWVHTMWSVGKPSIKGQMRMADKFNAQFALIMWQIEVRDWTIILRDMKNRSQEIIPFSKAIDRLIDKIGKDKLDNASFLSEIYVEPPTPSWVSETTECQSN